MVIPACMFPRICTRHSKSICWIILFIEGNSHQDKSKALAKSYTVCFHFSTTLSQKGNRLVWWYRFSTKPCCFSPQTLCSYGCFGIDFWWDIRLVYLSCSMTRWWIPITPHCPFSPFMRMFFNLLLPFTLTTFPNLHESFIIFAIGCNVPAEPGVNSILWWKRMHPTNLKCNQDFPRPYQHYG